MTALLFALTQADFQSGSTLLVGVSDLRQYIVTYILINLC